MDNTRRTLWHGPPALHVMVTAETQGECGRGQRGDACRLGGGSFLEGMDLGKQQSSGSCKQYGKKIRGAKGVGRGGKMQDLVKEPGCYPLCSVGH